MPRRVIKMGTNGIQIVDLGRGPQLPGTRLTVMDIFYYLHRGYDFDFIHRAMPSLSRAEFDAVAEYVKQHHEELVEKDRRVEERIQREVKAQHARGGVFAPPDENTTTEQRVERLREKLR